MKALAVSVLFFLAINCFAQKSPQPKKTAIVVPPAGASLSDSFSKAALKSLIAERDGSDLSFDALENAEVEAHTEAEREAFKGIQRYADWHFSMIHARGGSTQANAMIEQMAPGKCFLGLKAQYGGRTWQGIPKECDEFSAKQAK